MFRLRERLSWDSLGTSDSLSVNILVVRVLSVRTRFRRGDGGGALGAMFFYAFAVGGWWGL